MRERTAMISIPNFADKLCAQVKQKKSILCVGLDPQPRYMPLHLIREAVRLYGNNSSMAMGQIFWDFNKAIIDAVKDFAVCVKPNLAFYLKYGAPGLNAFEQTVAYAQENNLLVIGDAKCGDGGDTAEAYADGFLGETSFFSVAANDVAMMTPGVSSIRVDCLTVNGWIGEACLSPFIQRVREFGTGIFVVAKTSFRPPSAVEELITMSGRPVWQELAGLVGRLGDGTEGACGLRSVGVVMGATYPEDALVMGRLLPNSIFLFPGFGGQGATADDAVVGIRPDGLGGIVNNSRNLIYAWQNQKGKYMCASEGFANAARLQAIDDREELALACKRANKWPF